MSLQTNNIYEFEEFRLDLSEKILQSGGNRIPLTPKVFETLCLLVENAGHLIEKNELMQKLWQDRFVEESNLTFNIKMLRKALGDNAQKPQFIETIQSRGYRFIAKVSEVSEPVVVSTGFLQPFARSSQGFDLPRAETLSPHVAGQKRPARLILFAVGFAAAVALLLMLSFNFRPLSPAKANDVKSIAVLPVKPLSGETREPVYELGIADSLILNLSSANSLIVRPLATTRQYTDIGQDAVVAGREQKVDFVLASNYQIADGKIRITAQLYNVESGLVEGTFKVEQENSTIFSVQDAIAKNIGGPLLKKLNRDPNATAEKHYTTNEEAYRLYILGTALLENRRNRDDIRQAIEYYEQAVRLDPNFALAYAELASAHSIGLNGGGRDATDAYLKAKAALERALAIDETLAEAHSYLGIIKTNYEWDFAGAELEHRRAVELSPNSSSAHCFLGLLLGTIGKFEEAIAEMKTAIDLEPASAATRHSYGWVLFQARHYDEAIAEEERVVAMDPTIVMANNVLMNSYSKKGQDDKSFEAFVRMQTLRGDKPEETNALKTIYAKSGWQGISERQLEEAKADEKKGKPNYANLAGISIELGQNKQAIDYLEKAVDQNKFTLITLKVNPRYDPLRSNPRFEDLVRRVGLR